MLRMTFGGLVLALFAPQVAAQSRFSTSVVSYTQGTGGGIFTTSNALGGPQGGGLALGSLDVLSLGIGGDLTLGFDVTLVDGPGADFTVFENPFAVGGNGIFAEYAMVEVSSDGANFARFPFVQGGGGAVWGSAQGLAGGTPCLANELTNSIDPFDPVVSGGDAFDLAELAGDPLVQAGVVDLGAIHFVRLIDFGGADIDAVAVIQHAGNQAPSGPTCDLWRDANDVLHLRIADPDGLSDLDLSTFAVSANLNPLPRNRLFELLVLVNQTPFEVELVTPAPLSVIGVDRVLAVSVQDSSGAFSGDQISLAK